MPLGRVKSDLCSKRAKKVAVTSLNSELNQAAEVFFPARSYNDIGMLTGFQQITGKKNQMKELCSEALQSIDHHLLVTK